MKPHPLRTRLAVLIREHGVRQMERDTGIERSQLSKFCNDKGELRCGQVDKILGATDMALVLTTRADVIHA